MDANSRQLNPKVEYIFTVVVIGSLIAVTDRMPTYAAAFTGLIAVGLTVRMIYRMVGRQLKPADWSDKHPRLIWIQPASTKCAGCGYDCIGLKAPTCPECGKLRAELAPTAPLHERTINCQRCGYPFAEIAGRCPECGYIIRDAKIFVRGFQMPQGLLLAGVVSVSLVALGLTIFAMSSSMGLVPVILFLPPGWAILMGATAIVLAVGRSKKRDLSDACGLTLMAIAGIALLGIIALIV